MNLLYELGVYGPLILFFLSTFLLKNNKILFNYYLTGILLNTILNIILKAVIQQPRPSVDKRQFELLKSHATHYLFQNGVPFDMLGMPSGHALSSLFSLVFIYYSLGETKWLYIYSALTLITLYQRVAYNFHTISQIMVGTIIGLCMAYIMFEMAREKIKGKIRPKLDDNAPF